MVEQAKELAIKVSDLHKSYGTVKAVDGINFSITTGEVFGLLGPNGAGKSTTIEIITGMRKRTDGEVKVLGLDPEINTAKIKAQIGVQLQTVNLFPRLTVKEIVKLFSEMYPKPMPVDEVIEKVKLQEKSCSKIETLSGGQLRRVSIALAIVGGGHIIFLDEPTAGLDPQSRRNLWDVILELKNMGKTVFLSTHFMDEAQRLCDRVAIIDHGRIIALDEPDRLVEQHIKESALEFDASVFSQDERILELKGVTRVVKSEEQITLYTEDITSTIAELFQLSETLNVSVENLKVRQPTLEDVFLKLTGRSIRE